ncbi:PREDICTED: uncharacterized protein LOC108563834 isoform X2 [Nicrophorus vespilloides]|uniref:Uncharacterized protein LOC108563834 isoform X2 n=1 Tax=Nicrophorus vespilloides TaxID=110193 RepID=A0ABM1MU79_NICVS|nr:PREDICTED: uncharacterized protein LOC108563834 isoform X2 [Nicrophorus vespilloides]
MSEIEPDQFENEVHMFKEQLFNLDSEIVDAVVCGNNKKLNNIIDSIKMEFHYRYMDLVTTTYTELMKKVQVISERYKMSKRNGKALRPNTGQLDVKPYKEINLKHKKSMLESLIAKQEEEIELLKKEITIQRNGMDQLAKAMHNQSYLNNHQSLI